MASMDGTDLPMPVPRPDREGLQHDPEPPPIAHNTKPNLQRQFTRQSEVSVANTSSPSQQTPQRNRPQSSVVGTESDPAGELQGHPVPPQDRALPEQGEGEITSSSSSGLDAPQNQRKSNVTQPRQSFDVTDDPPHQPSWWERSGWTRWLNPRRKYWSIIFPLLALGLLAAIITLAVLYARAITETRDDTLKAGTILNCTVSTVSATPPRADAAIGAADVVLGVDAQTENSKKTILAYLSSDEKLCIRSHSNGTWSQNVQCLSVSIKDSSSISVLDWEGGPSIFYIDKSNYLAGLDYVPQLEGRGWRVSSLNAQKRLTNSKSQLATVTWLNGTSAWIYYQDINNQLREFGIDDFRNENWRDGSIGPLGECIEGSGIGAVRYTIGSKEYLEAYTQTTNDAIHGRLYAEDVWTSTIFSVDSTTTSLSGNAALTATTVSQADQDMLLLAYISDDGFLTIQSRNTVNSTGYDAFSAPKKLLEGDGNFQAPIAATGSTGSPSVYFEKGSQIVLLSADNVSVAASSWASVNL